MYKLYSVLILLCCIHFVQAQDISKIRIDKSYGNLPFKEMVTKIEKEHHIKVFFKEDWIKSISTPDIKESLSLDDFLYQTLNHNDLQYINYQGNIVLLPSRKQVVVNDALKSNIIIIGNPLNQGKYKKATVHGTILDGKTKEPIPGAQVLCEKLTLATSTNSNGEFSIELPVGKNKLKFSFIGLESEIRDIIVYNEGSLEIELYEETINLNQINVTAERPEDNYRSTSMGIVKMDMKSIKKLSVLMGEPDVIKSMTMLPGIQSTGENASGFNVRGGNIDQNLILVQETPVFNTSHMFGMFSMIDGNMVKDVTMYKSGIPARYGGRLSSVMNIELKKGQKNKYKVDGGIGPINSRLSVEGPIGDKITFIAGGRTTYSDWMLDVIKNYDIQNSSAHFYDFNAKVDYTINSKNKLSIFGYDSNDYFYYYDNAEYQYGNLLGSAKWSHIINNSNSGSLNINISKYNADIVDFTTANVEYNLGTSILQRQIAYHLSSQSFILHKINGGIDVTNHLINPGKSSPYDENSIAPTINLENENTLEIDAYLEDEYDITPELAIIGGLRYSNFWLLGPDKINIYEENSPLNEETLTETNYISDNSIIKYSNGLEPRLAFRYELENSSSIKLGYNRTKQYIRQISNSASMTPVDYWKASDNYLKPLIADQIALGYFRNFKNNMYETSLEVYYKYIQNEIDYKNGATIILNEDLEQELVNGIGKAYGAELLIKKNQGSLTGWLAYTYSRSFKKMDSEFDEEQINDGEWYKSTYDKPHDFTLVANYKISRRFSASGTFTYSTGRPATYPEQKYTIGTYEVIKYSDRNKYRLPDYHRLDLAITYEGSLLKRQKWRSSWTFSIYNVYGRNNTFSVFYEKQKPSIANNYHYYSLYKFAVIGVPIPSFTYNFWF